ncbi:DUF6468 domain-containing protein [Phaeovibrio sulfidiphilus]|uniref:DUF6468 domain-containing protein n=1 Tax=Phaeovibrio sulfidiphilus TaxID=1220600 RepID=UPI001F55594D|nr:DUF6468 domain-containing protein [Phaeovibrio sulfidiphilus]
MTFQVALDITIALLLLVFIGYAFALSRQLRELRNNRDEMARTIASFNEATARAEAGIPRLRKTAEDAGRTLGDAVTRARALRDDLAFMVERAEGLVPRMEGMVSEARPRFADRTASPAGTENAPPARSHWLDDDDLVPLRDPVAPGPAAAQSAGAGGPAEGMAAPTFSVRPGAPGAPRSPIVPPRRTDLAGRTPDSRSAAPGAASWPDAPARAPIRTPAPSLPERDRSLSELELLRAIRTPQRQD